MMDGDDGVGRRVNYSVHGVVAVVVFVVVVDERIVGEGVVVVIVVVVVARSRGWRRFVVHVFEAERS